MKLPFRLYPAALTALIVLAGCGERKEPPAAAPAQQEAPAPEPAAAIPEQSLGRFSVTETRDGLTHWTMEAASARIIELEQLVLLESPNVQFYEEGEQVSTLVASRGRIRTDNYDIWGEGECLLTTTKGERLETRDLHYRSDTRRIMTDQRVRLIRPNEVITGKGLEATPDLETIVIRNQRVEVQR